MPDLTSVTDNYFTQTDETYADNLSSSILVLAATVPVNGVGNYTDGQQVVITVEPGTSNQATFTGTVSGNSFINCVWTEGNLAIGHANGKAVVDYDSATHFQMLTKGVQVEHDHDGTHGSITPTAVSVSGQTWASMITGWLEGTVTWTYASATTFTMTGDFTTTYKVGTKLRLVQSSTTKYFYVSSSSYSAPTTTVTIMLTSDYTLANATISSPFYSFEPTPVGFPSVLNFTPTLVNLSGGTVTYCYYSVSNKKLFYSFRYSLAGAGVAGAVTTTIPSPALSTNNSLKDVVNASVGIYDDSATGDYLGAVRWSSGTTVFGIWYVDATANKLVALSSTVPFTFANLDTISVSAIIPLA